MHVGSIFDQDKPLQNVMIGITHLFIGTNLTIQTYVCKRHVDFHRLVTHCATVTTYLLMYTEYST